MVETTHRLVNNLAMQLLDILADFGVFHDAIHYKCY